MCKRRSQQKTTSALTPSRAGLTGNNPPYKMLSTSSKVIQPEQRRAPWRSRARPTSQVLPPRLICSFHLNPANREHLLEGSWPKDTQAVLWPGTQNNSTKKR
ncbi:hypothetical protein BASA81_003911 [Batrachochytrium salamandrivorans]|nr:hypothetical protein BASA81_003911 [Batrachochytrium salamandrivorans]